MDGAERRVVRFAIPRVGSKAHNERQIGFHGNPPYARGAKHRANRHDMEWNHNIHDIMENQHQTFAVKHALDYSFSTLLCQSRKEAFDLPDDVIGRIVYCPACGRDIRKHLDT